MKIIGLTGSIGMGKSTAATMLRDMGLPVFDADAAVHALQAKDGPAIPAIADRFPDCVRNGVLDRAALGMQVFADKGALGALEGIMLPMVAERRADFFERARQDGHKLVVLDMPTLFETGGDSACDYVLVVSAPPDVQRDRVLARPDMTTEKFENILQKQMPDSKKRSRADFVIDSGSGFDVMQKLLKAAIEEIRA